MTFATPPISTSPPATKTPSISESPPLMNTLNDENSGPYYLHHGDSPGTILFSQLLLGNNYPTWSCSMEMALSAKNKIGFIDGSIKKPSVEDS